MYLVTWTMKGARHTRVFATMTEIAPWYAQLPTAVRITCAITPVNGAPDGAVHAHPAR